MPEMDGFEVAEAISGYSKSKEIPIIFLSAVNVEKKFITKGYSSGGIDYVVKPFDPDILLLKVKTFSRLSEQTRTLQAMEKSLREEIEHKVRAEQLLKENVEELKSVLESIPMAAFSTDSEGTVEYVNHYWCSYSNSIEVYPETEGITFFNCIGSAILSKQSYSKELKIKNLKSGEYRFHVLHLTPIIKGAAIVKWVGIFTDIHEQKTASQLLEKRVEERTAQLTVMNDRLAETNRDLQQFASIASHDLQEPLRKIEAFSNIVLERHLQDDPKGKSFIERISSSASRLRKLINDLLSYSTLGVEATFVKADLNVILQETLNDMELKVEKLNPKIELDNLPVIDCFPVQIKQVFQNLIANSFKFCRINTQCELRITSERIAHKAIDSETSSSGSYFRITISDNGIGFNEQFKERIFEIFQRLNSRDQYEGTGIGLSIVKKVIERHHGLIDVTSIENKGTTFIIVLPEVQTRSFDPSTKGNDK